MTSPAFSPDWLKQFSDPYAILGVSVTADERRISKRYRQIAKRLHPDQLMNADEDIRHFANSVLTRLVNPAYQRLKQDKTRAETLATLRFKVRRLTREKKLVPKTSFSKQLLESNESEVDLLYEKALAELSETQYTSVSSFTAQTSAIAELNLIFLRRKMGDPVIREKRTGLMPSAQVANVPTTTPPGKATPTTKQETPQVDYAQRHVARAKTYIASKCFTEAIQELRDAVRIEPNNSNYHTMLGQAYLMQKMVGMAKVHIRQALKLDPKNPIAHKYAKQLEIEIPSPGDDKSDRAAKNGHPKRGLFSFLAPNHTRK